MALGPMQHAEDIIIVEYCVSGATQVAANSIKAVNLKKKANQPDTTGYTWFSTMTLAPSGVMGLYASPESMTGAVYNYSSTAVSLTDGTGTFRFAFYK